MTQRHFNAAAPELRLPPGRLYWADDSMHDPARNRPIYSMGDVAKFFFGRTYSWIAKRLLFDFPEILEGMDIERYGGRRHRYFRLVQVEELAHHLIEYRLIDGERFLYAISQVKLQACLWGYADKIEELTRDE